MASLPSAEDLAAEFVSVLKLWLDPVEFLTMRMLNAVEQDDLVCHSHDYCDANMAMDRAFRKFGADPLPDIDQDDVSAAPSDEACAATTRWNEAWEAAMPALGRGAISLATTDGRYVKVDDLWWDVGQRKIVTQAIVDNHVTGPVGMMVYAKAQEAAHAH